MFRTLKVRRVCPPIIEGVSIIEVPTKKGARNLALPMLKVEEDIMLSQRGIKFATPNKRR